MDKNNYLLACEFLYQLHTCQSLADLEERLYDQLTLFIPFSYASCILIREDPTNGQLRHDVSFCRPPRFAAMERAWLAQFDQAHTKWLSSSVETTVVRDSELLEGKQRFNTPVYQELLRNYDICDSMQMNVVYEGRRLARLAFYRTSDQGPFSDQDAFYLRAFSKHINMSFGRCCGTRDGESGAEKLLELTCRFRLTKREEVILGYIFQGLDNSAICDKLSISKSTLYKHNNSIFQKFGVKSRWELMTFR